MVRCRFYLSVSFSPFSDVPFLFPQSLPLSSLVSTCPTSGIFHHGKFIVLTGRNTCWLSHSLSFFFFIYTYIYIFLIVRIVFSCSRLVYMCQCRNPIWRCYLNLLNVAKLNIPNRFPSESQLPKRNIRQVISQRDVDTSDVAFSLGP